MPRLRSSCGESDAYVVVVVVVVVVVINGDRLRGAGLSEASAGESKQSHQTTSRGVSHRLDISAAQRFTVACPSVPPHPSRTCIGCFNLQSQNCRDKDPSAPAPAAHWPAGWPETYPHHPPARIPHKSACRNRTPWRVQKGGPGGASVDLILLEPPLNTTPQSTNKHKLGTANANTKRQTSNRSLQNI